MFLNSNSQNNPNKINQEKTVIHNVFPSFKNLGFYPEFYLLKVYQPDFLPLLQPLGHCEESESLSQQPARNSLISDPSSDPCWARGALTTRYSLLPTPCAGKPRHKFFFANNMTWKQTKQRFLKIPITESWNLSMDAHTDKKYLNQMWCCIGRQSPVGVFRTWQSGLKDDTAPLIQLTSLKWRGRILLKITGNWPQQ